MIAPPGEYIVELLVVIRADSATDAGALGERAIRKAWQAETPKSAGTAKIVNIILADVRGEDDIDPGVEPTEESPRS